ncbi:PqqD family protein [Sphingobacterium faecale]|uniref:PqqD family protein n=1 Tax=Sphingobacterium faecale TaxID=2803775 RepID=A0ABS1QXX9_9SPHI|nr:PqqD family protein [Sphingobacterium faecale]MBL1407277.1 PqqD family protein [Sphingobacterium faecale]
MKLKKDLVLRKIGEQYVVVDPGQDMVDMSTVFTLNSTSALLWKELDGSEVTTALITDLLCVNYDVPRETAEKDAIAIFDAFCTNGLLVD